MLQTGNLARFRARVHLRRGLLVLAFPAILAAPAAAPAAPCAVWIVRNALESRESWRAAVDAVERVGCRRIYLQVSGRWDAFFGSQVFPVPARDPRRPGWEDPVALAVADAHARGIEVHAWVNALLAWSAPDPPPDPDHVFLRHPDWFVRDAAGRSMRALSRADLDRRGLTGEGWFLDPAHGDVRTELRRFVIELAGRYPLDGIHLDYIRYPAGWAPSAGAETIGYLVGLIRDDLARVRPAASLSAAVLPVPAVARQSFGQGWDEWLARGVVDEVVPMVYRGSARAILEVVEAYPVDVARSRVRVGVRLDQIAPAEVRAAASRLEAGGFAGLALFSHNLLIEDPAWQGAGEVARLQSDFLNLLGPDAARADPDPTHGAVDGGPDGLEIGQESPAGFVVGMAYPVPGPGRLSADVTDLGHEERS